MGNKDASSVQTAGGSQIKVSGTFNVRPGIALVFLNGELVYDGEIAKVPPELVENPGAHMAVHTHMKQRIDAAQKKLKPPERMN